VQNTSSSSVLMSDAWKSVEKSRRALVVNIVSGKTSFVVTGNTGGAMVSSIITAGDSVIVVVAGRMVVVRRTAVSAVA